MFLNVWYRNKLDIYLLMLSSLPYTYYTKPQHIIQNNKQSHHLNFCNLANHEWKSHRMSINKTHRIRYPRPLHKHTLSPRTRF